MGIIINRIQRESLIHCSPSAFPPTPSVNDPFTFREVDISVNWIQAKFNREKEIAKALVTADESKDKSHVI